MSLLAFVVVAVLNLAFALSVMGFLIMHISLVAANTTTIEVNYVLQFRLAVVCSAVCRFLCFFFLLWFICTVRLFDVTPSWWPVKVANKVHSRLSSISYKALSSINYLGQEPSIDMTFPFSCQYPALIVFLLATWTV